MRIKSGFGIKLTGIKSRFNCTTFDNFRLEKFQGVCHPGNFKPVLLICNITKGYITKGYILKGYIAKGYIIKGYITKGYITKGYNFKRLHNKRLHF